MLSENKNTAEQLVSRDDKHELLEISYGEMLRAVSSPEVERILSEGDHHSICLVDDTAIEIRLISQDNKVWLRYKLRERVNDGTSDFSTSDLTDWDYGQAIDYISTKGGRIIEESTYWTDPRHPHEEELDSELAMFITNPFEMLFSEPYDKWLHNFQRVIHQQEPPRPGSLGLSRIGGLRKYIDGASKQMLSKHGFSHISAVPTWHHVALLYEYLGFNYVCTSDRINMNMLNHFLTTRGFDIRDSRSSWLIMLQFWADKVIQEGLDPRSLCPEKFLFYTDKDQILKYNLKPGRNVWMISNL